MRKKEQMPQMLPVKKWVSKNEAMAYLDLSINEFEKIITSGKLSVSCLTGGKKAYFNVAELDRLFQNNIIINKTA